MAIAPGNNRLRLFQDHPAPPPSPPTVLSLARRLEPLVVAIVVLSLVAGVALRVAAYARNQSLWIDEAMLALNVVSRSSSDLLKPLDLNQGAPVGYLLLSKSVVRTFGPTELAMRLPSLVASLVGMVLFVPLAQRLLPLGAARLAVILYALSPYLIAYSAEFKQYELDAMIAVGLLALGRPLWFGSLTRRRSVAVAIGGAMAVWFSHPAVFVLGGIGFATLVAAWRSGDRRAMLARSLVCAAWAGSFVACYLLVLRYLGANRYLHDYWAGAFLPLPPTKLGDIAWIVHHFLAFFEKPGGLNPTNFGVGGLAAACFLVGCVTLGRRDRTTLLALVVPLALTMLASGFGKYPFSGRLLLFAVPSALLLVASGAATIASCVSQEHLAAGACVLMLLFVGPLGECYWQQKEPVHAEELREALSHVHSQWEDGDRAFVSPGALPGFAFYHDRSPIPRSAVVFGADLRGQDSRMRVNELRSLDGHHRVWIVLSHHTPTDEAAITATLDTLGRREEIRTLTGATVLRYDLRE